MRSDVEYSTPGELRDIICVLVLILNSYSLGLTLDNEWQPLAQQFNTTTREIDESLSRVEKLSKFAKRSDRIDDTIRMQPMLSLPKRVSQPVDQAKLPCVILPAIRMSRFFDRNDVIEKIEDHFRKVDPDRSFRSLALYGLGGVGKSSVALRFAEAKLWRGELDAMFWVHSEKLVTIRQSFTDIAMRLKLPDARPKDHDENHALVLDWLRDTRKWFCLSGISNC
jgi:NB-ARC domain